MDPLRLATLGEMVRRSALASLRADTFEQALQVTLDAVCAAQRWPVGVVHRRHDGAAGTSEAQPLLWHLPSRESYAPLQRACDAAAGAATHALLGEGKPQWTPLHQAAGDPVISAAISCGLRGAWAVPVPVPGSGSRSESGPLEDERRYVLEFFSEAEQPPDAQFREAMDEIVAHLERRLLHDRDRERAEFLHQIVNHVAHPIFVKDRQYRFVELNRALSEMVGVPREQMLGRTDYDLFPEQQADHFRAKDEEMFSSAREVVIDEEPITDAQGQLHVLATTKVPLRTAPGEITHLVGIIHDLTQLKAAQAQANQLAGEQAARDAAEKGQRRLAVLAQAGRRLASSLALDETLERMAACAVPGFAEWCVVTRLDDGTPQRAAVVHAEPGSEVQLRALLEHAPLLHEEVIRTRRPRLLGPEFSPPRDDLPERGTAICTPLVARGRLLGAITFGRSSMEPEAAYTGEDLDLALQVADRAALALDSALLYRQAQEAVQARDEFLSIAAHELRTPLTTLRLHAEKLIHVGGIITPQSLVKTAEAMRRQVDRFNALIHNLLDVSRLSAGKLALNIEELDLRTLVSEVAERYQEQAARAGSTLHVEAGTAAVGHWDRLRIEQVVTNLLSNAIKYGAGQPIHVEVDASAARVQLFVRDRGIGIAKEDAVRIFERFERAVSAQTYGGLGLGLYICGQIVAAHGGHLRVESEPDKGTCFTMELPRRVGGT